MKWTTETTLVVVTAAICILQTIFRSGYRLLGICKVIDLPNQRWHADDSWMVFSILPLVCRTACMAWYFAINSSIAVEDGILAQKLLIPGRITYALYLWCMKLCLLQFYTRLENGSSRVHRAIQILRAVLVVTFCIILLATMIECRPLHLFWDPAAHDHPCRKGKANLLSMATLNIATDVALILFPIPMLWRMRTLDFPAKLQLTLLFFAGTLVIIITITRVPLILNNKVAQTTRTFWACVEIICATIVANAAFYYALLKDSTKLRSCFSPRANPSSQLRMTGLSRRNFYNDSTPSGFASSGEPLSQYISEPATEGSAGPSEAPNFSRKLEFGKQNPSSIV